MPAARFPTRLAAATLLAACFPRPVARVLLHPVSCFLHAGLAVGGWQLAGRVWSRREEGLGRLEGSKLAADMRGNRGRVAATYKQLKRGILERFAEVWTGNGRTCA